MTVYRNAQLMISAPESPFGTAATLDRWLPYLGNPSLDLKTNDQISDAMYPGAVEPVSALYRPSEATGGGLEFELLAKLFGRVIKWALGNGVHNLVSGTTYQSNFTLGAGPFFDALTIQLARQLVDGTFDVHTYLGNTVKSIEFKMDKTGILTFTVDIDGRTMVTNIAKGSPSVSFPNRFTFAGFSIFTGTFTEPTTTALPSAATALDGVKSWSMKIENSIVDDDYRAGNLGLKSQQGVLRRQVTMQLEMDYVAQAQALRTSWRTNAGAIPIVAKFEAGALSTGLETFVFAAPDCRISDTPTPNADGSMPGATINLRVLKAAASAEPLWICSRTSDTAL